MGTLLKNLKSIAKPRNGFFTASGIRVFRGISEELLDRDIVGYLSGYNLVNTQVNCSGFCDPARREIAIGRNNFGLRTIYHEIAHSIQHDLGLYQLNSFFSILFMEQQAETMAYYLYNAVHENNPLSHRFFDSYFKKDDIEFLGSYHEK
ncbi:hypothetical protein J4414_00050 [Candidatus Woesearchaeota archaeon]|nr:hypothetical protein [Candidatus Woesearchaeota archaeon]